MGGLTLAEEDVAVVVRRCDDLDEDLTGTGDGDGQVDERGGVVAGGTRGKRSLCLFEDDGLHIVHVRGWVTGEVGEDALRVVTSGDEGEEESVAVRQGDEVEPLLLLLISPHPSLTFQAGS